MDALSVRIQPVSCGRTIGPFACCSVIKGDCLEYLKLLPDGCVDAVITDPPYGMKLDASFKNSTPNLRKGIGASRGYPDIVGDQEDFNPSPWLSIAREQFWFGADYYREKLPRGGSWIVWDKREGIEDVKYSAAEFELCWTKKPHLRQIIRFRWFGLCGTETQDVRTRVHPAQKPWQVMGALIKASGASVVLDPYCGSGSTLVAAAKLGIHYLGFEISREYCEIAMRRLAEVEAQPMLFEPKPEQIELLA